MKRYKALIFDLFDTLIEFNRSLLPEVIVDGKKVRSTFEAVYRVFIKYFKEYDINKFHDSFVESYNEFQQLKYKDNKEYHNRERFKLLLSKLNIKTNFDRNKIVNEMVLAHMGCLANTMVFPEENRKTIKLIKSKNYNMAIISNFDHAPTAYMLLDKFDIRHYFSEIIISVEVGWRKPRAEIFIRALDLLSTKPHESIYIGDNFNADVIGSKSVGMDVIWINKESELLKEDSYKPDYTVSKFPEITNYF